MKHYGHVLRLRPAICFFCERPRLRGSENVRSGICELAGDRRILNVETGSLLGGGFTYFLCSPLLGEDFHFDSYFSNGLKPPTSLSFGERRLFVHLIFNC